MKSRYQSYFPYFIIIVVTFSVYGATLGYDFLISWDDPEYVTGNPFVQGITWSNIKAVFTRFFVGNYAPLQMLSYMVDHALWGMNAIGFRLTNLFLHTFSALFLFLLLERLTSRRDVSLIAAVIFAVHPLQVETVAWISQRKSLLAAALFLPAFYFYLSYMKSRNKVRYWTSVVLYGLSLLSKVSTITFPLLLLLYDFSFGRKIEKRNLTDKIPYFLLAGCMSLVAVISQIWVLLVGHPFLRPAFYYKGSLETTLLVTIEVLAKYVRSLLVPINLSAYYPFHYVPLPDLTLPLSVLLLILLIAGIVHLFRRNRKLGFWAAWFFVVMLPNLNIVPLEIAMADRYLYLPLIGPAVLFGYFMMGPFSSGMPNHRHSNRWLPYGVLIIILSLLCSLSYARVRVWRDDTSLWTDTAGKARHGFPYTNLGRVFMRKGQLEKAKTALEKALLVDPGYVEANFSLGWILMKQGQLEDAERYYRKALLDNLNHVQAHLDLGGILFRQDRYEEAVTEFEQALALDPQDVSILFRLSAAYIKLGKTESAIEQLKNLLSIEPENQKAVSHLSKLLMQQNRLDEGIMYLQMLLRLNPKDAQAHYNMAVAGYLSNRYDLAWKHIDIARELGYNIPPQFVEMLQNVSRKPGK